MHRDLYLYRLPAYLKFLVQARCLNFPLVVQMQTHSFCNGRCCICPYPIVSRKFDHGTMEEGLFTKICNELASEPRFSTLILDLQNEPLLDAKIFQRVKYFKSIAPSKVCRMVTNGELLDNFSLEEIAASNLDGLVVSLNAHSKQTYERINNGLNYDRVMKNINSLLEK